MKRGATLPLPIILFIKSRERVENMNKNYCVYMHKNKKNQKIYIGQTCQKPERRWSNGYGYKGCPKFYAAIQKYGWQNFEHIIIKTSLTKEQANNLQKELINQYDTINNGYNISIGGQESFANYDLREVICLNTKEIFNSTADAAEKYYGHRDGGHISSVCLGEREHAGKAENGQFLVWAYLDDYLDNPDKYNNFSTKKKNPGRAKQVICINTGKVFNTLKEAAEWSGQKSHQNISAVCRGLRKFAGKHPQTGEKLSWQYVK